MSASDPLAIYLIEWSLFHLAFLHLYSVFWPCIKKGDPATEPSPTDLKASQAQNSLSAPACVAKNNVNAVRITRITASPAYTCQSRLNLGHYFQQSLDWRRFEHQNALGNSNIFYVLRLDPNSQG